MSLHRSIISPSHVPLDNIQQLTSRPEYDYLLSNLSLLTEMDKEQIILLAGITSCALAVAAYVIWGPSPGKRKKGKPIETKACILV